MTGAMIGSTVQVHLNRACNLKCAHCYSMSGPQHREALAPNVVMSFLEQARQEGYTTLSLSGGEPLLYEGVAEVVQEAKRLGLATTVVTNGTLLNTGARRSLVPLFDLLAVSVDGPPELHNELRRSDSAFSRMQRGLDVMRHSGTRFGIIHTLTRRSLPHLPWLAEFAAAAGAALLQLHPLGIVGAASGIDDMRLGGEDLARAYLAGLSLRQRHHATMRIHIDLFNREMVRNNPGLVIPNVMTCGEETKLAHVLNPLVVMSNGDLSPICHAMHSRFRLGNIHQDSLKNLSRNYLDGPFDAFCRFCQRLWQQVDREDEWPYFNWYERLETSSHQDAGAGTFATSRLSSAA